MNNTIVSKNSSVVVHKLVLLVVLGALGMAAPLSRSVAQDPRYANTISRVSAAITNQMANCDVSALSIALVESNQVVWAQGFGLADRENNAAATEDTVYLLGPVSKVFTAAAVMQLAEQKRLGLDTPLTNYLPGLGLQERFADQPALTPRHLLAHLAGLPGDDSRRGASVYPPSAGEAERALWSLTNDYPAMPAGFMSVYCNNGWEVAQRLVEAVSGSPLEEYARTNLFEPAHMTHSAYGHDALNPEARLARPYLQNQRLPYEYVLAQGAGGMSSSAADLAQFLAALLGEGLAPTGQRLLQAATVREMFQPQSEGNAHTALAPYFGLRTSPSLRLSETEEGLLFQGDLRLQRLDALPELAPGETVKGVVNADETQWYRVPVLSGAAYTVELETTACVRAWVNHGTNLGVASLAHAFHFSADADGQCLIGVVRDGEAGGAFQLTLHTNALPFYRKVAAADWPEDLITYSNLYGELEFGYVFTPESRAHPTGNVLKIAVATMKSTNPQAQPLFFCNGGPGCSSIRETYPHFLKALTNDYNVYLIDQRGLGYSQPYLEPRPGESLQALQYRVSLLEQGDLSAVNTLESSYDVEAVHTALGLSNVNLLGLSYGTLLSQTLMRREPAWLRSVVLDGVVAPNLPPVSQTGPMLYKTFDTLFRDVAADPNAAVFYPQLAQDFYTLTTNLQAHPATIEIFGSVLQMDGVRFISAVVQQMSASDSGTRERIPSIIRRAGGGETSALAELYTGYNIDPSVLVPAAYGDMLSRLVLQHDILAFDSMQAVTNACAGLPEVLGLCSILFAKEGHFDTVEDLEDYGTTGPWFVEPVTSSIPTLVINGTYDTRTGLDWAAEVASHLPNSHFLAVPTVGHGVLLGGDCPLQAIRNFLAQPWRDPTPECLSNMRVNFEPPWPADAQELAGGRPLTNSFARAGEAAWYRFETVAGLYCDFQLDFAGGRALIMDAAGAVVGEVGPGASRWKAPGDGHCFLWLIAEAPATARLAFSYPLLLQGLRSEAGKWVLSWQGEPDQAFDIWAATNLLGAQSFVRVGTTPATGERMRCFTNTVTSDCLFYRVSVAGGGVPDGGAGQTAGAVPVDLNRSPGAGR